MPHPVILLFAVGTAAVGVQMVRQEVKRIRRALAEQEARTMELEPVTLERDPQTGIYRPRNISRPRDQAARATGGGAPEPPPPSCVGTGTG